MPLFNVRELLPFPSGDNSTDTLINGIHFNRTALEHFNYTLYDNGTLSNNSKCFLAFKIYQPSMFANGTFVNGTACDSPIDPVGTRGSVGIAFASLFAATIMFSLINLRKHGKRFLPSEKRWRAVGRRWSWYWLIALAACGTISCFMSIDVDRDYLQGIAIILQSFFYYLMLPIALAAVWEAVRHWGSWQERQICDRDTFALSNTPSRDRQEFYLPLIFYLFAFLIFFMTIPRSWSSIQKQHNIQQSLAYAKPAATDGRFKAGSIMGVICVLIICYSLCHSIYWYKERPHSRVRSAFFYLFSSPSKFVIAILLSAVHVGFTIASSFSWSISPLKYNVNDGYLYGLGYAPMLLLIIVLNIYGYIDPNEDRALIAQRVERGRVLDAELGIEVGKRKPAWWRRLRPGAENVAGTDPHSRLRALATEIGGGAPTTRNMERYLEMGNMQAGQRHDDKDMDMFTKPLDPFTDQASESVKSGTGLHQEHRTGRMPSDAGSHTTASSGGSRASQVQPQRVRSMLDI